MLVFIRVFFVFCFFNSICYDVFASSAHDITLIKTVTNITQHSQAATLIEAKPGDVLEYNIYVSNGSKSAISNIQIFAAVPQFTTLTAVIDCNNSYLPTALSCEILTPDGVNSQGYQGEIAWTLVGKLEAGVTARVSYQVTIK